LFTPDCRTLVFGCDWSIGSAAATPDANADPRINIPIACLIISPPFDCELLGDRGRRV
jgi:hypothetical protein